MKTKLKKVAFAMGHVALGFTVTLAVLPLYAVLKVLDDCFDITCP